MVGQEWLGIQAEITGEFFYQRINLAPLFFRHLIDPGTNAEIPIRDIPPDDDLAAMDTGTNSPFKEGGSPFPAKNQDESAGHVFPEKCPCRPTNDKEWTFLLILFHVNPAPVPDVITYKNHPATH